jgi:hypothetical protein
MNSEYENGCEVIEVIEVIYEPEYGGIYDSNFVFEDDFEEALENDNGDWDDDSSDEEEGDSEDIILEEIPFMYCPSKGETAEA